MSKENFETNCNDLISNAEKEVAKLTKDFKEDE